VDEARYRRQIDMMEIGFEGQQKLQDARILVIGAGGLGSPCLLYLAAAGVGHLGVADDDCVDTSNLQRQVLHRTEDVGIEKTGSAAAAIRRLNPEVRVSCYPERLNQNSAGRILPGWDFVVDATDNFASKFLISDLCVSAGIAYSHAGIDRFFGQCMTVIPGQTACYRCVFDAPPCEDAAATPVGPLGALPGIIGSIQATEAMKYILEIGELLTNRVLTCETLTMRFRCVPVARRADCRACAALPATTG